MDPLWRFNLLKFRFVNCSYLGGYDPSVDLPLLKGTELQSSCIQIIDLYMMDRKMLAMISYTLSTYGNIVKRLIDLTETMRTVLLWI